MNAQTMIADLRRFGNASPDAVQAGSASNSEQVRARVTARHQAKALRIADEIAASPESAEEIIRVWAPEIRNMDVRGLYIPQAV